MQPPDSNQLAQTNYHAGLLRLWREAGAWRASLQDAESSRRLGFADLDHLFAYLRGLTDDASAQRGTSTATER